MTSREINCTINKNLFGCSDEDIVPNFCLNPVASKQVKKFLADAGWRMTVTGPYIWINDPHPWWDCHLVHGANGKKFDGNNIYATADTEEMAVALAALKTIGIEVPTLTKPKPVHCKGCNCYGSMGLCPGGN